MPTAATRTDVEDILGVDLSADADRVDRLLERGERTVAGDLPGFRFGEVTGAVATVEADGDDILVLPYYPVRAVTSVTVDGVTLDTDAYTSNALGQLRRRDGGIVTNPHLLADGTWRRWPDRGVVIVVTYDYGYHPSATYAASTDDTDQGLAADVVRDVVAELAAGRIVNPSQVAQEALGDRSVSHGGATSTNADGLGAEQRRRLRHWRRNRVASMRVRS